MKMKYKGKHHSPVLEESESCLKEINNRFYDPFSTNSACKKLKELDFEDWTIIRKPLF